MQNEKLELLKKRHSVRSYTTGPVDGEILKKIQAEITMINTHEAGLFFQMRTDDLAPFDGFRKSYGFFRNARNYIACVVDLNFSSTRERAGYFAESLVVRMTELGLGTCFVGGTFDSASTGARIRPGETLLFLILFGYEDASAKRPVMNMMTKLMHRKDPSWRDFFSGNPQSFGEALTEFPKLEEGLHAVALAPSSLNKRPVRIIFSGENGKRIRAFVDDTNAKNLIDLGIAKFNFAFATGTEWEWGNYAPLLT